MVPTTHLLAFTITALVLIAIPGPSVLFTVSRAIALGRVAGVATVAGNTVGAFTQVVAVAFGLGPLVERSVALFTVLKLAGAAYLVYLGVQAIRHRRSLAEALGAEVERKTAVRLVIDGFTVGVTNPKVIVFFAAMLPQFVDRHAGDVPMQIIMLGAIFAGIALISDSAWALAAGTARAWLASSPRRLALIGGAGGLAMIGIGTRLALAGRPTKPPTGRTTPRSDRRPSGAGRGLGVDAAVGAGEGLAGAAPAKLDELGRDRDRGLLRGPRAQVKPDRRAQPGRARPRSGRWRAAVRADRCASGASPSRRHSPPGCAAPPRAPARRTSGRG